MIFYTEANLNPILSWDNDLAFMAKLVKNQKSDVALQVCQSKIWC